jgi:hypothetical protein
MSVDALTLQDQRGFERVITARNQRNYFGRLCECKDCGEVTPFRQLPWSCALCSSSNPPTLVVRPSDWWDQSIIETSRILVIGCGAVGNEVVKNLGLLGFKSLTLVDFDTIETHNLNRSILFHGGARKATESNYKVDVMAEALKMIDPEIEVLPLKTGVLDPRSAHKLSRNPTMWPDEPLDASRLKQVGLEHDLCIIATDGLAPKVFASRHLYHTLPIVQGAMNTRGTMASLRVSLPLTNGCIVCPTMTEPQPRHTSGPKEGAIDWRAYEDDVGENPCRFAAESTGALSFAHTTAMLGAAMASQVVITLHGWTDFVNSEFQTWPRNVPLPLWNEVAQISPLHPGGLEGKPDARNVPLRIQTDKFGVAECYNCRRGALQTVGELNYRGLYLVEFCEENGLKTPIHLEGKRKPPRSLENSGSPKPDRTLRF